MNDLQALVLFVRERGACREARAWLATQSDPRAAWEACERPDWMIECAYQRGVRPEIFVRIACDCARTVLWLVPEDEDRPWLAIEAAERWTRGEATIDEVRAARVAVLAVDAGTEREHKAVCAAADAAEAADAANYAGRYVAAASYVAYAAAQATADAADAYAGTRKQADIQMCQIIRARLRYEDVAL